MYFTYPSSPLPSGNQHREVEAWSQEMQGQDDIAAGMGKKQADIRDIAFTG